MSEAGRVNEVRDHLVDQNAHYTYNPVVEFRGIISYTARMCLYTSRPATVRAVLQWFSSTVAPSASTGTAPSRSAYDVIGGQESASSASLRAGIQVRD